MAAYGALMGLGNALQEVGMTKFKSTLANKLEQERNDAEEQRLIAREERQERRLRARPDPNQTSYIERDGALFKQQRNAYGDILDEKLASTDEIEKRNYTKQKQKNDLDLAAANLEGRGLANKLAASKANNADALSSLELRVKESQIRKNDLQGQAAMVRANKTGSGKAADENSASMSEYANLLKKESKDVIQQYTADDETLTATEVNSLARKAVEEAARFGLDPQQHFERLLRERASHAELQSAIDANDEDDE